MKIAPIAPTYTPQNLEKMFKAQINMFPNDIPYRRALAKGMGIKPEFEWILRPIIGLQEFTAAMKEFSAKHFSPGLRTSITNSDEREFTTLTGNFRAATHWHSRYCDGDMKFEDGLEQSLRMADLNAQVLTKKSPAPFVPFITSNTSHNSTRPSLAALGFISEDPFKYRNLRYVLGMEISADAQENLPKMHILYYGLNPFSAPEIESRGAVDIFKGIQKVEFGALGIAHPPRLFIDPTEEKTVKSTIQTVFDGFKKYAQEKALFIENNYETYRSTGKIKESRLIKSMSKEYEFINTGGLDSHANNIFTASRDLSQHAIDLLTTL